jgi:hypothetical protein
MDFLRVSKSDLKPLAYSLYRKSYPGSIQSGNGSIFNLPLVYKLIPVLVFHFIKVINDISFSENFQESFSFRCWREASVLVGTQIACYLISFQASTSERI